MKHGGKVINVAGEVDGDGVVPVVKIFDYKRMEYDKRKQVNSSSSSSDDDNVGGGGKKGAAGSGGGMKEYRIRVNSGESDRDRVISNALSQMKRTSLPVKITITARNLDLRLRPGGMREMVEWVCRRVEGCKKEGGKGDERRWSAVFRAR